MKKLAKKKKRPISDAYLLKLWAKIVKERAGYRCEYPDCNINATQLHPHHWYSRRHKSLRYDPMNGIALCAHHHTMGSFSAHHDPDFKDRILATGVRSVEWSDKLREKRNVKITQDEDSFRADALENLKRWGT